LLLIVAVALPVVCRLATVDAYIGDITGWSSVHSHSHFYASHHIISQIMRTFMLLIIVVVVASLVFVDAYIGEIVNEQTGPQVTCRSYCNLARQACSTVAPAEYSVRPDRNSKLSLLHHVYIMCVRVCICVFIVCLLCVVSYCNICWTSVYNGCVGGVSMQPDRNSKLYPCITCLCVVFCFIACCIVLQPCPTSVLYGCAGGVSVRPDRNSKVSESCYVFYVSYHIIHSNSICLLKNTNYAH
jgi:hypothetical protein